MGMPAGNTNRWTADEVREQLIQEDRGWPRYELVDGELLVTPAPQPVHQMAAQELFVLVSEYSRREALGIAFMSPADIELERDSITQPDVFVIANKRLPAKWTEVSALVFAAEIVSPSSARADRLTKREYYLRNGVPEYWVVDLDARVVERWRPSDTRPEILAKETTWQASGAATTLTVDLPAYFARCFAEDDLVAE
jgi:Uma2 family endonuclease